MENGFRSRMGWLHTWSGLIVGWLLFAIFVTGTSSYYKNEITLWMQPELHKSFESDKTLGIAIKKGIESTKKASTVSVFLPDSRSNTIRVFARGDNQTNAKNKKRGRAQVKTYDANTGEELKPRKTAGGNFLYRFHFELYSIPRDIARWIVGIVAMFMFTAIITGIIIHKRIFKDIFTFRAKNNPRGWMDAHILPGVATLPFLIMVTYSGLVLLANPVMPWAQKVQFGDMKRGHPPKNFQANKNQKTKKVEKKDSPTITKEQIVVVLKKANELWPNNVGSFSLEKNIAKNSFKIKVSPKNQTSIFNFKRDRESATYDAKTAKLISQKNVPTTNSIISNTNTALSSLHQAHFADSTIRFVLFISGIFGIILAGTGLILWTEKRKKKKSR